MMASLTPADFRDLTREAKKVDPAEALDMMLEVNDRLKALGILPETAAAANRDAIRSCKKSLA